MKRFFLLSATPLFCGVLLLAACSRQSDQGEAPAAQNQSQGSDAEAAGKLDTYHQLLRIHNDAMAVTMGHDILDKYPNSAAAKEVQQSLPSIEQRWKQDSEKNRLAALWQYQVAPMEGGTQSTATIYSSRPSGDDRVRLVLRRHTAWGLNAFLYGNGHGFVCKGNCTIASKVDDKPVGIKAFRPPTGEPALMIRDDKAFIAMLQKARKISMNVTLADDNRKLELLYEVGGFDASKWKEVAKEKGAGKGRKK